MTRALVIDDHPITLQGARTILEDMGIVAIEEAATIRAGYRLCLKTRPDLVIIDLTLEDDDLSGLALIPRIAALPDSPRMIVFSMHNDPTIVSRALAAGAASYVLKDDPSEELATAIRRVLAGEPYLSHALAMKLAMLQANRHVGTTSLTEREAQILTLLGQGNSFEKVAERLGISLKTVTNATSLMRAKLDLSSLADLIRFAMNKDRPGVSAKA
jgi:two-component system invasion response regulator UvrY